MKKIYKILMCIYGTMILILIFFNFIFIDRNSIMTVKVIEKTEKYIDIEVVEDKSGYYDKKEILRTDIKNNFTEGDLVKIYFRRDAVILESSMCKGIVMMKKANN